MNAQHMARSHRGTETDPPPISWTRSYDATRKVSNSSGGVIAQRRMKPLPVEKDFDELKEDAHHIALARGAS